MDTARNKFLDKHNYEISYFCFKALKKRHLCASSQTTIISRQTLEEEWVAIPARVLREAGTIIASDMKIKTCNRGDQDLCQAFRDAEFTMTQDSLCFCILFHFPFRYHRSSPKRSKSHL